MGRRILLVSDIHSNLAALDAVIQDAGAFDHVWCLGDITGYGPQPNECIEQLRAFDLVCLAGNHDLAVIGKLDVGEFSADARNAIYWTRERLKAEHVRWLDTLPTRLDLADEGFTLVHASPRDPTWEYVVSATIAEPNFRAFESAIGLNGHTHLPIIYRRPTYGLGVAEESLPVSAPVPLNLDRMLINPGSVGQPRDDDPRSAYAIVDLDAATLTHRRVQYDIRATQKLMQQAHLPDRLIRRLRFGE